ncbi:MAG: hypothetical protein R2749_09030 [Acidimicrobiales bacterium]
MPDEIVDRFCLIGPPEAHIEKLQALQAIGVDHAAYFQHDDIEGSMKAYADLVIPGVAPKVIGRR